MNESIPPVEEEVEELKFGDKVIYTDPEGNEITCKISKAPGDLHLGDGRVEITFDDGTTEGVRVKDVKRNIELQDSNTEILE